MKYLLLAYVRCKVTPGPAEDPDGVLVPGLLVSAPGPADLVATYLGAAWCS
jgi:hypothetical protein